MNDPIVDDVRRVRETYAARFGYDLDAIYRDIKDREQKSGLAFVGGVACQPVTKGTLESTAATTPH